jgi:hypothetical protein
MLPNDDNLYIQVQIFYTIWVTNVGLVTLRSSSHQTYLSSTSISDPHPSAGFEVRSTQLWTQQENITLFIQITLSLVLLKPIFSTRLLLMHTVWIPQLPSVKHMGGNARQVHYDEACRNYHYKKYGGLWRFLGDVSTWCHRFNVFVMIYIILS